MTIKYWWECGLVIICYPLECNLSSQVKLLWLCSISSLQLHLTGKKHRNLLLCICVQTVSEVFSDLFYLKCFDTCGNIWSLDRLWEKSNIFLNIKLSGRHITEIWLPEQPLKPPGRAAPGSSELAALKLALTLHLHGGSEAPCSETPHLNATTSEAGPPLRVERTARFASRINTCVCCCCFLFDWCFFCARSSVFLHQRSTSSSLSLFACHFDFPAWPPKCFFCPSHCFSSLLTTLCMFTCQFTFLVVSLCDNLPVDFLFTSACIALTDLGLTDDKGRIFMHVFFTAPMILFIKGQKIYKSIWTYENKISSP